MRRGLCREVGEMENKKPKYSFCITTYNDNKTIRKSLESILSQIEGDEMFEVVLVDAGSTDGSLEYLRELERKGKIRLIVDRRTRGSVGLGRQVALENARGDYVILYCDTDCYYKPLFKEILRFYHEKEKELGEYALRGLGECLICSRTLAMSVGFHDLRYAEDIDFEVRMWKRGKLYQADPPGCLLIDQEREKFKSNYYKLKRMFYESRDLLRIGVTFWSLFRRRLKTMNVNFKISRIIITLLTLVPAWIAHWFKPRYKDTFKNIDFTSFYLARHAPKIKLPKSFKSEYKPRKLGKAPEISYTAGD